MRRSYNQRALGEMQRLTRLKPEAGQAAVGGTGGDEAGADDGSGGAWTGYGLTEVTVIEDGWQPAPGDKG